jgi:hypothetical protein
MTKSNFGNDITNNNNNNNNGNSNNEELEARLQQMGATMIFPKVAGRGIVKVVGRCEDAKENNNLGRSLFR